jgi:ankyrin repeat protein
MTLRGVSMARTLTLSAPSRNYLIRIVAAALVALLLSACSAWPNKLNESARHGNFQDVRITIEAQPWRVNQYDDYDGYQPLHAAARGGQVGIVEYLIAQGANINAEAKDGTTAFQQAAIEYRLDTLKALVRLGAEPKLFMKNTPLLALVVRGPAFQFGCKRTTEVTRFLIDSGADVNSIVSMDPVSTVLTEAINGPCIDTITLLLKEGADPNKGGALQRIRAQTPSPRRPEIEKLLLSYGAKD